MSPMRVLVAPLNWGLGHATRCIPIIDQLLDLGHQVVIASDGQAGLLLKEEYPELAYVELPSYDISYPVHFKILFWLRALPRIIETIKREQAQIDNIVEESSIDCIISDNRYGVVNPVKHSILITHQLRLPLPWFIRQPINYKLSRWIMQFDECWIPDIMPSDNLSGKLSDADPGIPTNHLGIVSRMIPYDLDCIYDVCIILSGPEPHRSSLQMRLERMELEKKYKVAWVLGTPAASKALVSNRNRHSHLKTKELNKLICASRLVISRSGYTSIMDYHRLGKRAILIPTKGQPEQEYLAKYHSKNPQFRICDQKLANLTDLIEELSQEASLDPIQDDGRLKEAILKIDPMSSKNGDQKTSISA